jgi:hypothetical protein
MSGDAMKTDAGIVVENDNEVLDNLIDNAGLICETAEHISGEGQDVLAALAIALGRACFVNGVDVRSTFAMIGDGYSIQHLITNPPEEDNAAHKDPKKLMN